MSEAQQASASVDESAPLQVAEIPASAEVTASSGVLQTVGDETEAKMETENEPEPSDRPKPTLPGSGRFGGKGAGSLAALKALSENKDPTTDVSIEKVIPTAMEVDDHAGASSSSSLMGGGGKRLRLDVGGKKLDESGEFTVTELKAEYTNVVADHSLLFNMANSTGGNMFYPNELNKLAKAIFNKEEIVDVSYIEKDVSAVINWKWIFALMMFLLSLEWFLRKRNGAY